MLNHLRSSKNKCIGVLKGVLQVKGVKFFLILIGEKNKPHKKSRSEI